MTTYKQHVNQHKVLFKKKYGQEVYSQLRIDDLSLSEAEIAICTYERSFFKKRTSR